jgi:hypothetical protein
MRVHALTDDGQAIQGHPGRRRQVPVRQVQREVLLQHQLQVAHPVGLVPNERHVGFRGVGAVRLDRVSIGLASSFAVVTITASESGACRVSVKAVAVRAVCDSP